MNIQYITDEQGNKTAVVVPLAEWDALLDKVKAYEENMGFLSPEDEEDRQQAFDELAHGEALDLKEAMKQW
jgi:hypothetical protein